MNKQHIQHIMQHVIKRSLSALLSFYNVTQYKGYYMDIKSIAQSIKDSQESITTMSEDEVLDYRKTILSIINTGKEAVSKTSLNNVVYDDCIIVEHINRILLDGYNLTRTGPNRLADVQHLKRWKYLIKQCVQHSSFSKANFKAKHLRYQRSAIEQSSTIHTLRQNINAIIHPLRLFKEQQEIAIMANADFINDMLDVDCLIAENERLKALLEDRERVISEVVGIYNEPLKGDDKADMVDSIDAFKALHNATNEQACKVFGISASTLLRLRRSLKEDKSNIKGVSLAAHPI